MIPILIIILAIVLSNFLSLNFGLGSLAFWKQLLIFVPIAIIGLIVYRKLIIQPTVEKVNLLGEIEGFKKYIGLKKTDRDNLTSAPGINVEHFESILPHAFAFGAEKKWFSLFDDHLSVSLYEPSWSFGSYREGARFHSEFNTQIRKGSYKPAPKDSGFSSGGGFSSGSSGGGFSGGGGGGGSVGGW